MFPRTVVVIGCALAGPLLFAGCGGGAAVPPPPSITGIQAYDAAYAPNAADAGVTEEPTEPASSTAVALPYQGSSLCNASRVTGCYPDDAINMCDLSADNGPAATADGGIPFATPACHVVSGGLFPTTKCLPSMVAGMYASTCADPTQCSPGYECVEGGTCRHYCCAGNSACSSEGQFCDVQSVVNAPGLLVPVCVPLSSGLNGLPCVLLNDATCAPDEQCSVVRADGATSCITVGTAQDGDPCEREHCGRGLVCLGPLGSRRCEPLCKTLEPGQCTNGRTCIGTLPLFPNPTVGVCQ